MKSLEELQNLLLLEITQNINNIEVVHHIDYYNEIMGDTSILLTSILEEHLLENKNWDKNKWLDDCLLSNVKLLSNNGFSINGIMIWGRNDTLEEWTEPFYFEARTSNGQNQYEFLFGDLDNSEISYEEFKIDRKYWSYKIRHWRYKFSRSFKITVL
ncbi:hypothetical protein EG352_13995 [Chryseobacterium indologenes]|uniref:Uncharacterized protein n=1 Tax=Chryseobacterium indologenes TaxID=253 RepID=A0AAD0YXN3_CHRID|nr:hypothetical protein [Chryseobacterium indologenes]AZB18813.1 hypothetical protein EG352_13995 [Chryseobacterium indologenes]